MANEFEITRFESPIEDQALAKEVYALWIKVPEQIGQGSDLSWYVEFLSDRDRPEDRKLLYVARVQGQLVGTSVLWISRRDPKLAEFGLPATAPEFRGRGIGRVLFEQPVLDFREMGGEAIVMGGGNQEADRLYARVGYSKLVGSNALVQAMSGESPEAYFTDYFRGLGPATIHPGAAADRTPSVPLVHTPHDWQVMDCNSRIYTTRYFVRRSFAGQCGAYVDMLEQLDSTFFAARAGERQKVVGLSSAKFEVVGVCSVDGFTHPYYLKDWTGLILAAMNWARQRNAREFVATVSREDEQKQKLFKELGFEITGRGEDFFLDGVWLRALPEGRPVAALKMTRDAATG